MPPAVEQGPADETDTLPPLAIPHFRHGLKKSGNWLTKEAAANTAMGKVATKASSMRSSFDESFLFNTSAKN
jgi:hypothetical protein